MEIENLRGHKNCVGTHFIVPTHIKLTCKLGPEVNILLLNKKKKSQKDNVPEKTSNLIPVTG